MEETIKELQSLVAAYGLKVFGAIATLVWCNDCQMTGKNSRQSA